MGLRAEINDASDGHSAKNRTGKPVEGLRNKVADGRFVKAGLGG